MDCKFLEQMCGLRTFLYPHTSMSNLLSFDHTKFPFLVDFIILDLVLHAVKLRTCHSSLSVLFRKILNANFPELGERLLGTYCYLQYQPNAPAETRTEMVGLWILMGDKKC